MNQQIPFSKMHGLGNDFVIINNADAVFDIRNLSIPSLADRHLGIGFDQLLVIDSLNGHQASCRIFNADGSEAEQCGNGLRCLARYLHENHLCAAKQVCVKTKSGEYPIIIEDYQHISIDMGKPDILDLNKQLDDGINGSIISMGNPHLIVNLTSIAKNNLTGLAKQINAMNEFSKGINIGFMQINNRKHIDLRTFERGSGETLACGSNASAAVAAGYHQQTLDTKVTVALPKGNLLVEVNKDNGRIKLTGSATFVFNGIISE